MEADESIVNKLKILYEQHAKDILALDVQADLDHPVFGDGDITSEIMLIGEAPGAQEAKEGRPFIGKAGQQLDALLLEAGIAREQLFLTNAVKYRPTKNAGKANRTPTAKEILFSRTLLLQEIEIIHPKLIVTLGNSPLFAISNDSKLKIGAMHGTCFFAENYQVFALYHPASIIYNPALKQTYQLDLQTLSKWIQNNISYGGIK